MRDKNRIEPFLKKFSELWVEQPDIRFGQLVSLLANKLNGNPFNAEEQEWLEAIKDKTNGLEPKEDKVFTCNDCFYINITEEEQHELRADGRSYVNHKCLRYNKRIIHRCQDGNMIYPCEECKGNNYFKA